MHQHQHLLKILQSQTQAINGLCWQSKGTIGKLKVCVVTMLTLYALMVPFTQGEFKFKLNVKRITN
jgi:hypothetical protein